MRRQTSLGDLIHPLRTDLHLHPFILRAHHRDVQALVTVGLRDGDPVLHTLRVGLVHIGDDGVDLPAFRAFLLQRRIQYDPDSEKIVDTLEFHLLLFQLVINGMYGFGTPLDIELESCRCQLPLDRGDELGDISVAGAFRLIQFPFDEVILFPVRIFQGKVFQLALDRI